MKNIPKSQTRHLAIQVRVTPEEKKEAAKKAQDKGQTLCAFIRESLKK